MDQINKIIVVGGGTSGLMAALMLQKQFSHLEIQVIESSSIGTIGVGEGATEHWKHFCHTIGVSLEDTLVHCNATLKAGIKFSNWGIPDYIHNTVEPYAQTAGDYSAIYAKLISEGASPLDIIHKTTIDSTVNEAWLNGAPCPQNQFHFNTFSTVDYLHKLCSSRNISVVDDKIIDVVLDESGNITKLVGEKINHNADFFIDSSGFSRVLMKKLGAKWVSYKDHLWVNSAIAFPTEDTDEYPIYTQATAMDAGWMWNTPVNGRWGNGYVFCDEYLDFDQAQAEVETKLGRSIDIAKKIKFDSGKLDKSWIKNCACIGLASSFVEPLESSAISQTVLQTFLVMNLLPGFINDPNISTVYNKTVDNMCNNILDFISLHYYVPKDNTSFWKDLKTSRHSWMTESLKSNLEQWTKRLPLASEFDPKYVLFTADNWIVTLHGMGLLDQALVKKEYQMIAPELRDYADLVVRTEKHLESTLKFIPHKVALRKYLETHARDLNT